MSTHRGGKSALDEFLPERALAPDVRKGRNENGPGAEQIAADEIRLDPVEDFPPSVALKASPVQLWPMLAAALVAIGVALLALAAFAKFFHTTV